MFNKRYNKRKFIVMWVIIFICIICTSPITEEKAYADSQTIYYVSTDGDDSNAGTISHPFATLDRARDAIRELKHTSGIPAGGVTVYIREGEYILTDTFTLTPDDSGEVDAPIIYRSYPGEEPIISGGINVGEWTRVTENIGGITPEANGNLWVADIPQGERVHYFYINGIMQQVARQYNHDVWRSWYKFRNNSGEIGTIGPNGQWLKYRDEVSLENLPSNGDMEMLLINVVFWNSISVIKDVDPITKTVWRHSKNPNNFAKDTFDNYEGGGYSNLINALPFLDRPGEWCVNSTQGKIYYWPYDENMDNKNAVIPVLNELIRLEGDGEANNWQDQVHDIEFRGLTLMYSDRLHEDEWSAGSIKRNSEDPGGAVYLQGVRDCVIEGNKLLNIGAYGIAMTQYNQNNRILRNELGFLGCGGIELYGYGPGNVDVNKNNIIERNYIHHIGLAPYSHSAAITIYGSNNNTIKYNYIRNVPYAGISIVGVPNNEINDRNDNTKTIGGYDTYWDNTDFYQLRDSELPDDLTEHSVKAYLHSENNVVEKNIVRDYMMKLNDGGALYSWHCGDGTKWKGNILYRINPLSGLYMYNIYLDSSSNYCTLSNNITWCNNTHLDKGISNTWINNPISYPNKPQGYDELLNVITNEVNSLGGWPESLAENGLYTIEAENSVLKDTSVNTSGSIKYVEGCDNDDWIMRKVDFGTGMEGFEANVCVEQQNEEAYIEIRLDSPNGNLIGTLNLTSTGEAFNIQSCAISNISGIHDIYMVFKGANDICKLDWFRLIKNYTYELPEIIQAEDFSNMNGVEIQPEGTTVGWCDDGDWLCYNRVNFGNGYNGFTARVGVDNEYAGRVAKIRLDSPTGRLIGTLNLQGTGGWEVFEEQSTIVSGVRGLHDVYIVFEGGIGAGNFDWFEFSNPISSTLPVDLELLDIGIPLITGSASYDNQELSVTGAGSDIWGSSDQFAYVNKLVKGNSEIIARVTSLVDTDEWAKAGLMFRESGDSDSNFVDLIVTPSNGLELQWRTNKGGNCNNINLGSYTFPVYLKLIKSGNTFSAYKSVDGINWSSSLGSCSVDMNSTVKAGICVSSHNPYQGTTAKVDNIDITSQEIPTLLDIQAEGYNSMNGVELSNEGTSVGWCDTGDWLCYENIDLGGGFSAFTTRAAVDNSYAGRKVEIRLDGITGTIIGTLTMKATGGWDMFQEQSTDISDGSGIHDVYIVFKDGDGAGNFDWFRFQ
ncbi:carbohydrate-binding protein [Vallitalea guaymasensis]|uniref:Carbohydrate-binding protein n=1 Tax=Vallitalea guaymasensis TaxID=1185412 RepID=A0A8J8MAK4_9FIRM|nr:carbohydrate-binding protein [Vallitalea guaymasensis]QUH29314.1 carbohydrate-binding protein [Vallitalea guaymasensis]